MNLGISNEAEVDPEGPQEASVFKIKKMVLTGVVIRCRV